MIEPYLPAIGTSQDPKLRKFLNMISAGYREFNVSYHNDIHGFDVCQMSLVILQGPNGLQVRAGLSQLDCLASLIAGACHDYKHDGFTNLWHKNKDTDRY